MRRAIDRCYGSDRDVERDVQRIRAGAALRGFGPAVELLEEHRRTAVLHSSVVVRAEVLAGMRPREEQRTRELLNAFDWACGMSMRKGLTS